MLYELKGYGTDSRYYPDIRYREYTTSRKRAEMFSKIPKIPFSDSGHGIVFCSNLHIGNRKPVVSALRDYVFKEMHKIMESEKKDKKSNKVFVKVKIIGEGSVSFTMGMTNKQLDLLKEIQRLSDLPKNRDGYAAIFRVEAVDG